jgi:hypothetical protein
MIGEDGSFWMERVKRWIGIIVEELVDTFWLLREFRLHNSPPITETTN